MRRRRRRRGDEPGEFQPFPSLQAPLNPTRLLALQQTVGNQTVNRMLRSRQRTTAGARLTAMPAATVARAGKSPPTIRKGATGPFVEEAQQHLNRHGASPPLVVDGIFGPLTKAATLAFQASHQDTDGNALASDGIVGPKTWGALRLSAPSAGGPDPAAKAKLKAILAKGDAMSPAEAAEAKKLLFQLEGDEFKAVLKEAIASGAFVAMLKKLDLASILDVFANLTTEVVIPTTLFKPGTDTIADDFKRANEIYNPHGIEIERGNHIVLSEKATKKLLGADTKLEEFTTDRATAEELRLVEMNRMTSRIAGYWVPDFFDPSDPTGAGSRGEALLKDHLKNLGDDRESVVVNTNSRAQDTFAHEVGHALGLEHEDSDPKNLMASGGVRKITGADIDQLTPTQLAQIRASVFAELGRKGVGK